MTQDKKIVVAEIIKISWNPETPKIINPINGPKAEPKSAQVLNFDNSIDLEESPLKWPVMDSKDTSVPTLKKNNNKKDKTINSKLEVE